MRKFVFFAAAVAAFAFVAAATGEAKAQNPWGTASYYTAPAYGYYAPAYGYAQTYRYAPGYAPTYYYYPPQNVVYYTPMSYGSFQGRGWASWNHYDMMHGYGR
jgi:hypothetical protein